MLTDDDLRKIALLLEDYGLEKNPTAGAIRTRRYRERKASQSVTRQRHKTSHDKGQGVTKASHPNVTPTSQTWGAYLIAYHERYGVDPVRNGAVNGQLAQFVGRIGASEAPQVAVFYLHSNRGLYVSAKHPTKLLLRDAESLRTEWATGHAGTDTEARQADRTAATGNVFTKLIGESDGE